MVEFEVAIDYCELILDWLILPFLMKMDYLTPTLPQPKCTRQLVNKLQRPWREQCKRRRVRLRVIHQSAEVVRQAVDEKVVEVVHL